MRFYITGILGTLWFLGVVTGFTVLALHEFTAGDEGTHQPMWPQIEVVTRSEQTATLVMSLHPQCGCSRASVEELSRIRARVSQGFESKLLFLVPTDAGEDWRGGGLWDDAARIPGVEVIADRDGTLAKQFGLTTSGHVLLYDRSGVLRFSGGITASRGHAGDNRGSSVIASILSDKGEENYKTPVFGCSLGTSRIEGI